MTDTFFRTVHYLGNKSRMVDFIKSTVDELDPSRGGLCDLFSGTGVVGQRCRFERAITAVDIQFFSKVLNEAVLNPIASVDCDQNAFLHSAKEIENRHMRKLSPLIELEERFLHSNLHADADIAALCEFHGNTSLYVALNGAPQFHTEEIRSAYIKTIANISNLSPKTLLATRYLGGVYFSYKQAATLDAISETIESLPANMKNTYRAALLSTASELVNTVGNHFAQPLRLTSKDGKPKTKLIIKYQSDRKRAVFPCFKNWLAKYTSLPPSRFLHTTSCSDFESAINSLDDQTSVIYADPPYTRDHYSRFYHGLETLALNDFPQLSTSSRKGSTQISIGHYRSDRHQSPFCIRSTAPTAFDSLVKGAATKEKVLLISYSPYKKTDGAHPRSVEIETITAIARQYYHGVEIRSPGRFTHSKLNRSDLHLAAADHAEVLICCTSPKKC